MFPLFETISIENHQASNLPLHQARMDRSYLHQFGNPNPFDLVELFNQLILPTAAHQLKWRLCYNQHKTTSTIEPYRMRSIKSLKLAHVSPSFDYAYKYTDRTPFDALKSRNPEADEIIIVKEGLITDSSYSNLVLKKGNKLYTPARPLLKGVQREYLIQNKLIEECDLFAKELFQYSEILLINAMLPIDNCPKIKVAEVLPDGNRNETIDKQRE